MLKYSVILLAACLSACSTVDLQETTQQKPAAVQLVAPVVAQAKPAVVATPPVKTEPEIAKPPTAPETFECRVKWKDGAKSKITDVFKVRVDFIKKEVQSGSFKATASNIEFVGDVVKFTGYNKHLIQISDLNRTTGKLDTRFMSAKNHVSIDGSGQCSKLIVKAQ